MKWISVNEQLPEGNMQVLVAASLAPGIKKMITLAHWSLERNEWEIERDDRLIGINFDNICYWMPIPAPPEPNDKK
jgi:hypothetical protein